MLDYSPVGGLIALMGVIFITFIGWRLIPKSKTLDAGAELLAKTRYHSELTIPKVSNLIGEESLYYIKLLWDVSAYDAPGEGPNPPPEGYDGDLELADYYMMYRDGVEYQEISSDTLFFVDDQLTPEEEKTCSLHTFLGTTVGEVAEDHERL